MSEVQRLPSILRSLLIILIIFLMLRAAWISDDALITLRHALNLNHGWGPGFNATENVQAFTHPLWFLLWLGAGALTSHWILGILVVSVLLASAAILILLHSTASLFRITLLAILLLLSNSFFDYTTSGLENSLAYLLIALLFTTSVRLASADAPTRYWHFIAVGLSTAAIALTRLDLLVLVSPTILLLLWKRRQQFKVVLAVVGAALLPIVLWFIWSYSTYSALLPNTFLAKTNAQIPRAELLLNGVRYIWVSFSQDPISLVIIAAAIALSIAFGTSVQKAWMLGAGLYVTYIVWVGGDFMAGRFLAVPIFVSLFVLATVNLSTKARASLSTHHPGSFNLAISLSVLLLLTTVVMGIQVTSLANPQNPRWDLRDWAGVADERGEYVQRGWTLADLLVLGGSFDRGDGFRSTNNSINDWPTGAGQLSTPTQVLVTCGQLGILGLQQGPSVHIVDECALADRFLAQITYIPSYRLGWRPGHLNRDIPDGYIQAIQRNDPSLLRNSEDQLRLMDLWQRIR